MKQDEAPNQIPRIPKVRTIVNSSQTELYDGKDLLPHTGREGALDFLRLPSRIGNRLIYRKGVTPASRETEPMKGAPQ